MFKASWSYMEAANLELFILSSTPHCYHKTFEAVKRVRLAQY